MDLVPMSSKPEPGIKQDKIPNRCPNKSVYKEFMHRHFSHACRYRYQMPHNRHKPADKNCLVALLPEPFFRPLKMLFFNQQIPAEFQDKRPAAVKSYVIRQKKAKKTNTPK